MHYLSFNDAMRARFGTKVYRLSLQSGCTCPNRDGKIATGGCTFCSEGGSGDFAAPLRPIAEQIEEARKRVDAKIPASIAPEDRRYIAYFQSYTNTCFAICRHSTASPSGSSWVSRLFTRKLPAGSTAAMSFLCLKTPIEG